jgi:Arylsulfotransferase (ASST)
MLATLRKAMAQSLRRGSRLRHLSRELASGLPRTVFILSIALLTFAAGFFFRSAKWPPYVTFLNIQKTLTAIHDQLTMPFPGNELIDFSGGKLNDVSRNRIIVRSAAPEDARDEHFLMSGGLYQFLDYCLGSGCIAAEFTRVGKLVHAYPYRPQEFEAHEIVALPYEQVFFRFSKDAYPMGTLKLPSGDLIVTFQQWATFPFGGGIARIRPDGSVVWFRHDYSHHWPTLLPDGSIAVPAMRIAGSELSVPLSGNVALHLDCDGKIENDIVRIIDPDGHVQQEISVLNAFLHSPYRGMINRGEPCDPLHLNYVAAVTKGIVSLYPDVAPGDLIVSLRNIDAFAILGRKDHRLKHLFTGTFLRQHCVQPLGQSAIMLIFDDHGADWRAGPSRFLAYDLADHREHTLLPEHGAPIGGMFSDTGGYISVSPDLSRAIVTSTLEGRAYEVRLSDGKIMTVFNDVHDLHRVSAADERRSRAAARFTLYTVAYVH